MGIERTELYDGKVELAFDTGKHVYTASYGDKSAKIPGVTSITGLIDKSGPLMGWAVKETVAAVKARLVPGVPLDEVQILQLLEHASKARYRKSKDATDVGHLVHSWVEAHIRSITEQTEHPAPPVNPQVANGVGAFLTWESAHKVEYVFTERRVASIRHWYAGTTDILAVVDSDLVVVDLKTSKACPNCAAGVYDEYLFQTAAYQGAIEEEFGEKIDGRIVVRVDKETGLVDPHDLRETSDYEADLEAFLHARGLFKRIKGF